MSRFFCHCFAILLLLAAPAFAQKMEVILPNGTKKAVTISGEVTVSAAGVTSTSKQIGITIDGAGTALTTGVKGYIQIPFACTITGWTLLADVSGSVVVDVWKDTYANYPPTIADVITASAKPTLSSAIKNTSTTLTGWTTSIAAGDVIAFNVNSATTVTRVTLTLDCTRP